MREGDRDPLWAWFWMNQGMTIPFLQNRELLSWSIMISLNVLNPLKSILWIPPWGLDFTSLPIYKEINPAVPAAAKETPYKHLRMTRRVGVPKPLVLELWVGCFHLPIPLGFNPFSSF
jgi:hypothetical protein